MRIRFDVSGQPTHTWEAGNEVEVEIEKPLTILRLRLEEFHPIEPSAYVHVPQWLAFEVGTEDDPDSPEFWIGLDGTVFHAGLHVGSVIR